MDRESISIKDVECPVCNQKHSNNYEIQDFIEKEGIHRLEITCEYGLTFTILKRYYLFYIEHNYSREIEIQDQRFKEREEQEERKREDIYSEPILDGSQDWMNKRPDKLSLDELEIAKQYLKTKEKNTPVSLDFRYFRYALGISNAIEFIEKRISELS